MLKKHHLIAGEWVIGSSSFTSDPAHGPAHDFAVGTPELVDRAANAAEDAFWSYGYCSPAELAQFLVRCGEGPEPPRCYLGAERRGRLGRRQEQAKVRSDIFCAYSWWSIPFTYPSGQRCGKKDACEQ